ncbi:MAG: S1C family serine protease, partial [Parabacteroides sp.]|nr:S1C family serine protease [Parabacteroides sp.]
MPRFRYVYSIALVICFTILLTSQNSLFALDSDLTVEERQALASANNLSKAFIGVAKLIRPAVVNIKVERKVLVGDFNNPSDFFSDFFNQRFPGRVRQRQQTQLGQGSGVIIDPQGYILTNNHVVGDADAIRVVLVDGREVPAELIGSDPDSDVAVIRIDVEGLTIATVGDSDLVEVGVFDLAVGTTFGVDSTVTSG